MLTKNLALYISKQNNKNRYFCFIFKLSDSLLTLSGSIYFDMAKGHGCYNGTPFAILKLLVLETPNFGKKCILTKTKNKVSDMLHLLCRGNFDQKCVLTKTNQFFFLFKQNKFFFENFFKKVSDMLHLLQWGI
jgi:hypothetical protein